MLQESFRHSASSGFESTEFCFFPGRQSSTKQMVFELASQYRELLEVFLLDGYAYEPGNISGVKGTLVHDALPVTASKVTADNLSQVLDLGKNLLLIESPMALVLGIHVGQFFYNPEKRKEQQNLTSIKIELDKWLLDNQAHWFVLGYSKGAKEFGGKLIFKSAHESFDKVTAEPIEQDVDSKVSEMRKVKYKRLAKNFGKQKIGTGYLPDQHAVRQAQFREQFSNLQSKDGRFYTMLVEYKLVALLKNLNSIPAKAIPLFNEYKSASQSAISGIVFAEHNYPQRADKYKDFFFAFGSHEQLNGITDLNNFMLAIATKYPHLASSAGFMSNPNVLSLGAATMLAHEFASPNCTWRDSKVGEIFLDRLKLLSGEEKEKILEINGKLDRSASTNLLSSRNA